jgi:hypothetical protein
MLAHTLGLRRVRRARYEGSKTLEVVVYEMASQTAAFELLQRWQHDARKLAFYQDRFFYVVDSFEVSPASRQAFAKSLEQCSK